MLAQLQELGLMVPQSEFDKQVRLQRLQTEERRGGPREAQAYSPALLLQLLGMHV